MCQQLTNAFRQRLVPLASRLAGEDGGAKQVVSWVTVIKDHCAKGEVAMLNLALPDGVGWDPRIRAVDH